MEYYRLSIFWAIHSRTHPFSYSKCFPRCQFFDLTAHSLSSALPRNHPPLCSGLEWLAQLEKLIVVVMAEMLMHTVEEQGVHTMDILDSRRDLGGFSN